MQLTWEDFKNYITSKGVEDKDIIRYIDITGWFDVDRIETIIVKRDPIDNTIAIYD